MDFIEYKTHLTLTAPQKLLSVGDYWIGVFLEVRHSNRNHVSICQDFYEWNGKKIKLLIRFGENSEIDSVSRNEKGWSVRNVLIKYIVVQLNAVHTGAKRAKINSELSRSHCGKTNQPEFCCHGLSKGLVWIKKCFEFSMEIIRPKQWKAILSFSAYNWQKYHYTDLRIKTNAFTGKRFGSSMCSATPKEVK